MQLTIPFKSKKTILALGPESAGNFTVFKDGQVYFSEAFGDLLTRGNFIKFKKSVLGHLKKQRVNPDIVITDRHPAYCTTEWGETLAKKYNAKHIRVQHHIAHIFSAIGDKVIQDEKYKLPNLFYGIGMDGTGYGDDGLIWGGEVFQFKSKKLKVKSVKRIGHLENHWLLGGDLAVREPARMLMGILGRFLEKDVVYGYMKKYYTNKVFELFWNQMKQTFNSPESSSTGRVLDAAAVLLGFSENERKYKHGPAELLDKNSTIPYKLSPVIKKENGINILETTPLFKYLINNLNRDKKRLAATVMDYIARGLYGMSRKGGKGPLFFAGGMSNYRIIYRILCEKGAYSNQKIPRGDAGLSFGQLMYYLSADAGD